MIGQALQYNHQLEFDDERHSVHTVDMSTPPKDNSRIVAVPDDDDDGPGHAEYDPQASVDRRMARVSISGFLEKDRLPTAAPVTAPAAAPQPKPEPEQNARERERKARPGDPVQPLRTFAKGGHRFGTYVFLDSSIRARRPQDVVPKPDMVSRDEWWAVHAALFFNHASVLYGRVVDRCQGSGKHGQECVRMRGGRHAEYLFSDGRSGDRAPRSAPAISYISHLFTWLLALLEDPRYFPDRDFATYPDDFDKIFRLFIKRIFRIFAHLNWAHRGHLRQVGAEQQLDDILLHLLFFVKHFKLMDRKEYDVMRKRYDQYAKELGLDTRARKEREERK